MQCLNDETFLKFENSLLDRQEMIDVKKHLKSCAKCSSLFKFEREFDLSLKKALTKDHRVKGFVSSIVAKLKPKKAKRFSFTGKLAVAGGIMWCMAVFNAILLGYWLLHANDFSMAKLTISIKDFMISLGDIAGIYSFYMKYFSASLYFAIIIFFIAIFNIRYTVLKFSRN